LRYAIPLIVYKDVDIEYDKLYQKHNGVATRLLGWPEGMAWRFAKAGLEVER
jgi:hypothetical protein